MMISAEEYQQRARHCEEAAQATGDVVMRGLFLDLAEQWLLLASDASLLDRKRNEQ
jgi:hypothetical protein